MAENINNLSGVAPRVRRVLDGGAGESQAVFCLRGTVGFGDDGTAVTIGVLPANSDIVGVTVDVTTGFDDSGTDLLDVGTSGTADHYQADIDVSSAGQTVTGYSNFGDVGTSDVTVQATYTGQNSDSSAGSASVTVFYVAS